MKIVTATLQTWEMFSERIVRLQKSLPPVIYGITMVLGNAPLNIFVSEPILIDLIDQCNSIKQRCMHSFGFTHCTFIALN